MAKKKSTSSEPKSVQTRVEIGDIVYWFKNGITSNTPLPAIVTVDRGTDNLAITVFAPDGHWPLDGVKHKDDPNLRPAHLQRVGCWAERE
ncbi:MAG: hypothetical protein GY826_11670 [Fuerstiella sp.]|jgi:hypothetical protein|nr:hypothetical protein [Fuerstiella sp.]